MNGVTTDYYLNGSNIVTEIKGSDRLDYYYDEQGNLFGFKVNNASEYYYIRNGQNDIIGILDSTGAQVVSNSYDTWGKLVNATGSLASTIGALNPFRYRGYYYDESSGLYYLNSRYYDANTGRFINADATLNPSLGLTGMNLFAYCSNNPVNMADNNGNFPFLVITGIIGAVIGAVAGGISYALNGDDWWEGALIWGAVGGVAGLTLGAASAVITTGTITATTSAVAAGTSAISATISAGGTAAAANLITENISRAINGTGTVLYSGGEKALQAARESGGKVINDSIGKAAEIITKNMPSWEQAKPIWEDFSARFCQQASGTVNAYVSNSAYKGVGSVFWSVEMPALINNSKVTDIVIHIFN